jgi:hypothetical protein
VRKYATAVLLSALFISRATCLAQTPPGDEVASVLTGAVIFSSDANGSTVQNEVWDTEPDVRNYWNLWFCFGTPRGNPDGLISPFINGPSNEQVRIAIPIKPGTNQLTFFGGQADIDNHHAINLFFRNANLPNISAKAATRFTLATVPPFSANTATNTYALNDQRVPGAGTLTFDDNGWTITLAEFFWAGRGVFGIDRITRGSPTYFGGFALPDGTNDMVGALTLVAKPQIPGLEAVLSGTNVDVSWPSWVAGYDLEASDDFSKPDSWTTITNAPTLGTSHVSVSLPIVAMRQFYRLRKQNQ